MPNTSKGDNHRRKKLVCTRLSLDEYDALAALANRRGQTVRDFVAAIIAESGKPIRVAPRQSRD